MRVSQVAPVVNVYQLPTGTFQNVMLSRTYSFGSTNYDTVYTVPAGRTAYLKMWGFVLYITTPATTFEHAAAELVYRDSTGNWGVLYRVDLTDNLDDFGIGDSDVCDLYMREGDSIRINSRGYGSGGEITFRVFLQLMVL